MSHELYNFLQKIKEKPVMYLRKTSLVHLTFFIIGYSTKEYELGIVDNLLFDSNDFNRYCATRYTGAVLSPKDSFMLIAENSKDDEEAFYNFFTVLEEYLKS